VHVARGRSDLEPVFSGQALELDAAAVERAGGQRAPVELGALNRGADELDEGGRARLGAFESDLGRRRESFRSGRQIESDIVVKIRQEGGPAPRLLPSQVVANC
jgi:hypothetical protein